jgi:hypothetical protein
MINGAKSILKVNIKEIDVLVSELRRFGRLARVCRRGWVEKATGRCRSVSTRRWRV